VLEDLFRDEASGGEDSESESSSRRSSRMVRNKCQMRPRTRDGTSENR